MQGNAHDEEHIDEHGECAAEIKKLQGLLRSAKRYVEGYAENDANHPQARDGARSLLADINSSIT